MSSLASQLQRLSGAVKGSPSHGRVPSFLFSREDASRLSVQDVLEVGVSGLEELKRVDARFAPLERPLFSPQAARTDRLTLTAAELQVLDGHLTAFLRLLTPLFLLKSAHKALEFLIRRFQIHEFNSVELLRCCIPYHETPQFARLLQLLRIRDTPFAFLAAHQREGAAVTREALVNRALQDPALLEFFLESAQELWRQGSSCKPMLALCVLSTSEVLQRCQVVEDPLLRILLPFIFYGLSLDSSPAGGADFFISALILLSQLSSRVTFSHDTIVELLRAICHKPSEASLKNMLLCLMHLSETHDLPQLEKSSLSALLRLSNFFSTMEAVLETYLCPAFAKMLFLSCLQHRTVHSNFVKCMTVLLQCQEAHLHPIIPDLAVALLETFHKDQDKQASSSQAPAGDSVATLLRLLSTLYPNEMDAALDRCLHQPSQYAFDSSAICRAVFGPLSRHSILRANDEAGASVETTLFLGLHHPYEAMRVHAVRALSEGNHEDLSFVAESLTMLLEQEQSYQVLCQVLCVPGLSGIVTLDRVIPVCTRLLASVGSEKLSREPHHEAAVFAAIEFLTSKDAVAEAPLQCLDALLPCLLCLGKNTKISVFCWKHLMASDLSEHELVKSLAAEVGVDLSVVLSSGRDSKASASVMEVNVGVLHCVGRFLAVNGFEAFPSGRLSSESLSARASLMRVLSQLTALEIILSGDGEWSPSQGATVASNFFALLVKEFARPAFRTDWLPALLNVKEGQLLSSLESVPVVVAQDAQSASLPLASHPILGALQSPPLELPLTGLLTRIVLVALSRLVYLVRPSVVAPSEVGESSATFSLSPVSTTGCWDTLNFHLLTFLLRAPTLALVQHPLQHLLFVKYPQNALNALVAVWSAQGATLEAQVRSLTVANTLLCAHLRAQKLVNADLATARNLFGDSEDSVLLLGVFLALASTHYNVRAAALSLLTSVVKACTVSASVSEIVLFPAPTPSKADGSSKGVRKGSNNNSVRAKRSSMTASSSSSAQLSEGGQNSSAMQLTLLRGLLQHREAIRGDRDALPQVLQLLLDGGDLSLDGPGSSLSASCVVPHLYHQCSRLSALHSRALLLGLVAKVPHPSRVLLGAPLLEAVVAREDDSTLFEDSGLPAYVSHLLQGFSSMHQCGADTLWKEHEDALAPFLCVLQGLKVPPHSEQRLLPVCRNFALVALGQLNRAFFSELTAESQRRLFWALCTLSSSEYSSPEVQEAIHSCAKDLPFDFSILAEELERVYGEFSSVQQPPTKTPRKRGRAAAGVTGKNRDSLIAALRACVPKCTTGITLVMQVLQDETPDADQLGVPALFRPVVRWVELLGQLGNQYQDDLEVDFAQQMALSFLVVLLRTQSLTRACKTTSVQYIGVEDVDVVAAVVREDKNPQTRNQALLALRELAQLFPEHIIGAVMPVLTVMGSSSLAQDDKYTHVVVSRTLEAIIPPVLEHGVSDGHDILKIFVSSAAGIPSHRRLPLFLKLIKIVSEDHLFTMIQLLLLESLSLKNRSKSKDSAESDAEAILELARLVLGSFGAAMQTRVLTSIMQHVLSCWLAEQGETHVKLVESLQELTSSWSGCQKSQTGGIAASKSIRGPSTQRLLSQELAFALQHLKSDDFIRRKNSEEVQRELLLLFENLVVLLRFVLENQRLEAKGSAQASEDMEESEENETGDEEEEEEEEEDEVEEEEEEEQEQGTGEEVGAKKHRNTKEDGTDNHPMGWTAAAAASTKIKVMGLTSSVVSLSWSWTDFEDILGEILSLVNMMLSIPSFLAATSALLQHDDPKVQRRALSLLNARITRDKEVCSPADIALLMDLIPEIEENLLQDSDEFSAEENSLNSQVALWAIEILARNFASVQSDPVLQILPRVVDIVMTRPMDTAWDANVVASASLALASICSELGLRTLSLFPKYFPRLLTLLEQCHTLKAVTGRDLLRVSLVTAVEHVVRGLPRFVTPHLPVLFRLLAHPQVIGSKNPYLVAKGKAVFKLLRERIHVTALLPSLAQSLKLPEMEASGFVGLYDFFSDLCKDIRETDLRKEMDSLFELATVAISSRELLCVSSGMDPKDIERVEKCAHSALVELILRLNEKSFRTFIMRLVDWAHDGSCETKQTAAFPMERILSFYILLGKLSKKLLKTIMIPYFAFVWDHIITLLRDPSTARLQSSRFQVPNPRASNGVNLSCTVGNQATSEHHLLCHVLRSLHGCFLFDNQGFVDKERFHQILGPLCAQLENTSGGLEAYQQRSANILVPVLGQLAVCVAEQQELWQPLNHHILTASRNESPSVRYASLLAIRELYRKVGAEMMVHLPESIPYLAELLDDADAEVETLARDVQQALQEISGEDLTEYFM